MGSTISFAYNHGGAFNKVTQLIREGKVTAAMETIKSVVYIKKKKSDGLVNRRKKEVNLYLNGDYGE
jgi:GH24 family phage-related lysozyme (muramidase)